MKNRYVPVKEVPIFFYLKATSKFLGELNGFKLIKVYGPQAEKTYIQTQHHIWVRT